MREFETKNNQEKFTCGEFEYQVIRSARKTMTLEVRRDGNVIVGKNGSVGVFTFPQVKLSIHALLSLNDKTQQWRP